MRRRAPNRLRPNTEEPTITQGEAVDRIAPHLRTGKDAGEVDRVLKGRVRKKIAYAVKIGALTPLPGTRRVFNRNSFRKWAAQAWPATPTDALGPGRAAFHEPKAYSIKATPPVKRGGSKLVALEQHVFPWIGQHAIANLKRADIRGVLRRIEGTGRIETAYRVLQLRRAIFEYAIAEEICEHTPAMDYRRRCCHVPSDTMPASRTRKKVGELMRAIEGFSGTLPVACTLRLAPLLFVRPGELRKADWSEFDLDGSHPQWRIPASRMKMREQHIVPLAKQAVGSCASCIRLPDPTAMCFPA